MADTASRARACFQRGESQLRQKAYCDAETSFRDALKLWAEVEYPASNEKASTLHGLGLVMMQESKFSTAETYLNDSLSVHRRMKPRNNPETLSILQAIGACLLGQGKLIRGEKVLQECLDLSSESSLEQRIQKAGTTYELGRCLLLRGNYSRAEEIFIKALELFEKDPCNSEYLSNRTMCLNCLAECTFQQFKIREAVSLTRMALSSLSQMLSSPSELKPTACCLLALCLQVSHAPQHEVGKLLRQTQELCEFVGDTDTKALVLSVIGEVKTLQGKYEEASQMLQHSLLSIENVEFVDLEKVSVSCRLAECLLYHRKHQQARELLEKLQTTHRDILTEEHPLMGRVLLCQGRACCDGKKWEEAEVLLQSAFCILRKTLPSHPRTCEAMMELSYCLKIRGKNTEAADVLASGRLKSSIDEDRAGNLTYLNGDVAHAPNASSLQEIDHLQAEVETIRKEKKTLQMESEKLRHALVAAPQQKVGLDLNITSAAKQGPDKITDNEKLKLHDVPMIQPKHLRVFNRLGEGAFGEVHVGHFHGSPVAVKTYSNVLINQQTIPAIKEHLHKSERSHHPNIIGIYGATINDGLPVQIVMELTEGSLSAVMNAAYTSGLYLTLREQIDLSVDCLAGLDYLHNLVPKPLVHGDICLSNVLVTSTMQAKLSDIGESRFMGSLLSVYHVSIQHTTTKGVAQSQHTTTAKSTRNADIYNLGTALVELFAKHELKSDTQISPTAIPRDDIRHICTRMIANETSDGIDAGQALLLVENIRTSNDYNKCPPKRMVKGQTHRQKLQLH